MAESSGVWLYGIAEQVDASALTEVAGVGGGTARTVQSAGLTAVVSDVDLAQYGESALRRNLEDMDWLAATARAHHRVIDAAARRGPVVPMRLASVYRTDSGIAAFASERADGFRAILRRLSHRKEWGVKAYAADNPSPMRAEAPAVVGGSGDRTPGGRPPGDRAERRAGAGAAYLRRRKDQLTASHEARRQAMASAQAIHAELSGYAVDSRLHPPQAPQLSGEKAVMLLNAAYLLDEVRGTEFAAAVTALAGRHPTIQLVLTGPWPAYSFVDSSGPAGP